MVLAASGAAGLAEAEREVAGKATGIAFFERYNGITFFEKFRYMLHISLNNMNLCRIVCLIVMSLHIPEAGLAQQRIRLSLDDYVETVDFDLLKRQYGRYKEIPPQYEKPALIALSYYPELKDICIRFVVRDKKSPLLTRPEFFSALFKQPHNRTYLIIISKDTEKYLKHIEFSRLNLDAQVGVLGHELTHVVDFSQRGTLGLLRVSWGNLSSRWIDHFEFETDRKTIDHGLGFQLLAWSNAVRDHMIIRSYSGIYDFSVEDLQNMEKTGRERYMKPATIMNIIREHPLYEEIVTDMGW